MKQYKNFKYKVKKRTVRIMEYLGHKETLIKAVIPTEIKGLKVVFISVWTFKECKNLEEIVIPQYVNNIAPGVFCHCTKLKKVRVNKDNLTYSFQGGVLVENGKKLHTYLQSNKHTVYTIPNTIIEIGEMAFKNHPHLVLLTLPVSVKKIEKLAFCETEKLTELFIPDSVTEIGKYAFCCCRALKSVVISKSVETIKEGTFMYCESLEEIIIEEGIKTIRDEAFLGCTRIRKMHLPSSIKYIGDFSFNNCFNLKEIKLPSSVTYIGRYSFSGCAELDNIQLPPTLRKIPDGAFSRCDSLKQISIPPSVKIIEDQAFGDSEYSLTVTVFGFDTKIAESAFKYRDYYEIYCYVNSAANVFAQENGKPVNFLDYKEEEENSERSPQYQKRIITQEALAFCKDFETIFIPKMEITIGECVFKGDNNLFEVKISNSVMHIQEKAFAFFKKINKVHIPKSVVKIEQFAFFGCSNLAEIIIEGENTYISRMAFGAKSNCTIFCKKDSMAFRYALEQGMKLALI